jgi:hypothetical protein
MLNLPCDRPVIIFSMKMPFSQERCSDADLPRSAARLREKIEIELLLPDLLLQFPDPARGLG